MQAVNMRQGQCRREMQREQVANCTLPHQRIRCCGRVLNAQEMDLISEKKQGKNRRRHMAENKEYNN